MKEESKKGSVQIQEGSYVCPECGKPLNDVQTTESHRGNVYEVNLKASHAH
jgi:hypothetical protein